MTSRTTGTVFSLVPKFKSLFPTKEKNLRTQFPSLLSELVKDATEQETQIPAHQGPQHCWGDK